MTTARAALISSLLCASPALAGDVLSFGVGAHVVAGTNWLDQSPSLALPGNAGFGTGVGASAEVRVLGLAGLEVDFFRSVDRGEGKVSLDGVPMPTQEIGQPSWHVPVVAKVLLPVPVVKPYLLGGVDLVIPNGSCNSIGVACTVGSYSMWVGGIGAEISLPIPVLDMVRIPVSLRYEQNRDNFALSTQATSDGAVRAEWGRDLHVTAGAILLF